MIKLYADQLATLTDFSIINVVVNKQNKAADYDVFENAWRALIQRFENTIQHRNFPGPMNSDERGMLICDHTDDKKLMALLRRLHRFNPVPNLPNYGSGYRDMPLRFIIEDPSFRNSLHSYFIQSVDLAAFLLYQHIQPSSYIRKKSAKNYFLKLDPILCKRASISDPYGIVRL